MPHNFRVSKFLPKKWVKAMVLASTWELTTKIIRSAKELSCEEQAQEEIIIVRVWHWWLTIRLEGPMIMPSYAWSVKKNKDCWGIIPLASFELMKSNFLVVWHSENNSFALESTTRQVLHFLFYCFKFSSLESLMMLESKFKTSDPPLDLHEDFWLTHWILVTWQK
jgi:hypothetical protein